MAREAFDVVVLGTGAAALTAAIAANEGGASVGLFEKADQVGGTTAWSGAQVWIPNNPHMADVGVEDSRDKAITYIMSLSRDMIDRRLVEAYVDAGPEMVSFVEAKTPVPFCAVPGMPDYHPEFPGASPGGGRTIECPSIPSTSSGRGPTASRRRRPTRTSPVARSTTSAAAARLWDDGRPRGFYTTTSHSSGKLNRAI